VVPGPSLVRSKVVPAGSLVATFTTKRPPQLAALKLWASFRDRGFCIGDGDSPPKRSLRTVSTANRGTLAQP
jgi:hypothetical protein